MNYRILATDYDGTLATDGRVTDPTLAALNRWKAADRQLILITGRQFDDLLRVCSCIDLFDSVVAENGAVLYDPQTQAVKDLGDRPPQAFIDRLRERIVKSEHPQAVEGEFSNLVTDKGLEWLGVGRVIVATWVPHDRTVQDLIQEMELDQLQIIMNKGAVMVLPSGIDKTAGLKAALQALNQPADTVIGVGDAENDADFLHYCGYAVAVANALTPLKEQVDWVTEGSRGNGVIELIDRFLAS
ncbi:MAG: hypothetical protein Kow00121_68010 [Elainellaceae cyanobacterium]